MQFLVIRPNGKGLSKISVHKADDVLKMPFESWALSTGKSIIFVNNNLQGLLKQFYMFGTFEKGAVYAYDYDDLCKVIEAKIGPSDRARATMVPVEESPPRIEPGNERGEIAVNVFAHTIFSLFHILWIIGKVILVLILIPLIIAFVSRRH